MTIAAIAATPGPDAASNPANAPGLLGDSGPTPFQALLNPALAAPPAPLASANGVSATPVTAPTLAPADTEPLAADAPEAPRPDAAASGQGLPPVAGLALLLPGLVAVPASAAGGPASTPRSPAAGGVAATAAAAAAATAQVAAQGTAEDLSPSPLPQTEVELGSGNAAANAYLQRFTSDPHRLPPDPTADLGGDPLLRDVAGPAGTHGDGSGVTAPPLAAHASLPALGSPVAAPIDAPSQGFRDSPGSAQWQRALDDQLMVMVSKGNQHARIRMHPEELGQLDIRIAIGKDRVDLNFAVQHTAVAQALNQHLPHLAQLFAEQGLAMGQASVSQQQADGGNPAGGGDGRAPQSWANAWTGQGEEIVSTPGNWTPLNRGLFDAFA